MRSLVNEAVSESGRYLHDAGISFCAALVLLCMVVLYPGCSEAALPGPHKVCTSCHSKEGPPALRYGINETCMRCHPPAPGRDHPVNVVQTGISGRLPLDPGNRLTCITCHDPHGKGTAGKMLRMEFNRLCVVCHRQSGRHVPLPR